MFAVGANGPTISSVVTFNPPAVKDTHVGHAIDGRLHAAGAARLAGASWIVEPDIDTCFQVAAHVHIIVFNEGDTTTELMMLGQVVDRLDKMLARIVCRVRLAGKDELQGPVNIQHEPPQAAPDRGRPV